MNDEAEVIAAAEKAITEHIAPMELKGAPAYHFETGEWLAIIAVTPWGPLVRVAFRLSMRAA